MPATAFHGYLQCSKNKICRDQVAESTKVISYESCRTKICCCHWCHVNVATLELQKILDVWILLVSTLDSFLITVARILSFSNPWESKRWIWIAKKVSQQSCFVFLNDLAYIPLSSLAKVWSHTSIIIKKICTTN